MIASENLQAVESHVRNLDIGQHKISCPLCSHTRTKNKHDKPLSVNVDVDKVVFNCHHCSERGIINHNKTRNVKIIETTKPKQTKPIDLPKEESNKGRDWLETRSIDPDVAKIMGATAFKKKNRDVIGFAYGQEDKVEGIKYRSINDKIFWWEGNSKTLWGRYKPNKDLKTLDDTIIITEGEMDALSVNTALKDHLNIECYSVPNGSPNKISDGKFDEKESGRFQYVWEERDKFEGKTRVVLATDNDSAGDVLAYELGRRLNLARCYRVDYGEYKDMNELLMNEGKLAVIKAITNAQPIPMHNLNSIQEYATDFQDLYDNGQPKGITTGLPTVDEIFTLSEGNLVVVSGMPGDGKSAFIDQLCVNVAKNFGWKTCFASFEKPIILHSAQLSELYSGKPFFDRGNGRMTQEEKDVSELFIKENFLFQDYFGGELPTIEAVLEKARSAVLRHGIKILVIDPFNYLHYEKVGLDTDAISDMLTKIQLFCKQHSVLCFFVCHPAKPTERTGKKQVVTGLDIAKSMSFYAKADIGLTVYRTADSVQIHNWKTRFTWWGKVGMVELDFDIENGRYKEKEYIPDNYDWSI